MSMFDNYDNIYNSHIKTNIKNEPAKVYNIIDTSIPAKIYDIKNKFIGYQWYQGETFELDFTINNIIKVKEDSIIYDYSGKKPNEYTKGYAGLQAYNLEDNISWTCSGLIDGLYVWIQDDFITYDKYGTKEIELEVNFSDKSLQFEIVDFRGNILHSIVSNGPKLTLNMDSELSNKLKGSLYKGYLSVLTDKGSYIKDKFILSVL